MTTVVDGWPSAAEATGSNHAAGEVASAVAYKWQSWRSLPEKLRVRAAGRGIGGRLLEPATVATTPDVAGKAERDCGHIILDPGIKPEHKPYKRVRAPSRHFRGNSTAKSRSLQCKLAEMA